MKQYFSFYRDILSHKEEKKKKDKSLQKTRTQRSREEKAYGKRFCSNKTKDLLIRNQIKWNKKIDEMIKESPPKKREEPKEKEEGGPTTEEQPQHEEEQKTEQIRWSMLFPPSSLSPFARLLFFQ